MNLDLTLASAALQASPLSSVDLSSWIEKAAAVGTTFAAIFAAISAWYSKVAIKEARLSRRIELAPKLILEKEFLDFEFIWPHTNNSNGGAAFLARKHWHDKTLSPPTFSLQNFGQSPALDLTIVWDLNDPNGKFELPDGYKQLGLSVSESMENGRQDAIKSLVFARPGGNGESTGLPLYRKWTTDIPSCAPGQQRQIEFPLHILNTLFLRGLQLGSSASDRDIILTATISCYAVDGFQYKTQFRWKAVPFHYGQKNPVVVNGHFFEIPNHPKPKGPRVA